MVVEKAFNQGRGLWQALYQGLFTAKWGLSSGCSDEMRLSQVGGGDQDVRLAMHAQKLWQRWRFLALPKGLCTMTKEGERWLAEVLLGQNGGWLVVTGPLIGATIDARWWMMVEGQ